MIAAVQAMNADPRVTGIIVQRPIPPQINVKRLQSAIHPLKDVEGLHPASIGSIVYNELDLGPCTAMASVHILKTTGPCRCPGSRWSWSGTRRSSASPSRSC